MEKTEFEVDEENRIEQLLIEKRREELRKIKKTIVRLFFEMKRARKLSYRNLASLLGCNHNYLVGIESGKEKPSTKILAGMLEFLF